MLNMICFSHLFFLFLIGYGRERVDRNLRRAEKGTWRGRKRGRRRGNRGRRQVGMKGKI